MVIYFSTSLILSGPIIVIKQQWFAMFFFIWIALIFSKITMFHHFGKYIQCLVRKRFRETALNVFREEIMDKSSINKRLVSQLLRVIDEERNGKHINRDLVKNLLRMLTSLQIYTQVYWIFIFSYILFQVFEREFISASGDLFSREGDVNARDLEVIHSVQYNIIYFSLPLILNMLLSCWQMKEIA